MGDKQTSTLTHAEHQQNIEEAIQSLDKTPGISGPVRTQVRQSLQIKLNTIKALDGN